MARCGGKGLSFSTIMERAVCWNTWEVTQFSLLCIYKTGRLESVLTYFRVQLLIFEQLGGWSTYPPRSQNPLTTLQVGPPHLGLASVDSTYCNKTTVPIYWKKICLHVDSQSLNPCISRANYNCKDQNKIKDIKGVHKLFKKLHKYKLSSCLLTLIEKSEERKENDTV